MAAVRPVQPCHRHAAHVLRNALRAQRGSRLRTLDLSARRGRQRQMRTQGQQHHCSTSAAHGRRVTVLWCACKMAYHPLHWARQAARTFVQSGAEALRAHAMPCRAVHAAVEHFSPLTHSLLTAKDRTGWTGWTGKAPKTQHVEHICKKAGCCCAPPAGRACMPASPCPSAMPTSTSTPSLAAPAPAPAHAWQVM